MNPLDESNSHSPWNQSYPPQAPPIVISHEVSAFLLTLPRSRVFLSLVPLSAFSIPFYPAKFLPYNQTVALDLEYLHSTVFFSFIQTRNYDKANPMN